VILEEVTTIGRQPTNSVQIFDRLVSKEHAVIAKRPWDGAFLLRDLGSRNGTFHNERQIDAELELNDGDKVRVGATTWEFIAERVTTGLQRNVRFQSEAPPVQQTMAIGNMRDFAPAAMLRDTEALRRDYEKLRIAYKLGEDLHRELDLDRLLDKLLGRLFEWLKVDRGVVLLVADQNSQPSDVSDLVPRAVKLNTGTTSRDVLSSQDEHIDLPHTIIRQVIRERNAVISSDARMDERFGRAESIILQGIRSSMTVPLIAHDRLLGILHVDSLISTGLFGEKDLAVLEAIARQAALAIDNAFLAKRIEEDAIVRQRLSRMLSPNLVERVASGELSIEKGGVMREVSILFADIRGFTAFSERTPAEEIVLMLNDYFERVSEVIFEHEGTLDKYMGDAVMALWGAPLKGKDDPWLAVSAALQMQRVIRELNVARAEAGLWPLNVGIGVDTGVNVAGYVGATRALSYTVIGASVNLASRLCSASKGGEVLISENTMRRVEGRVVAETRPPIPLKGFSRPMASFNITGFAPDLTQLR